MLARQGKLKESKTKKNFLLSKKELTGGGSFFPYQREGAKSKMGGWVGGRCGSIREDSTSRFILEGTLEEKREERALYTLGNPEGRGGSSWGGGILGERSY